MPDFENKSIDGVSEAESAVAQRRMEIDELLAHRLDFLSQLENAPRIVQEVGKGDTSHTYDCHSSNDAIAKILKVSTMAEGISASEVSALKRLGDIPGIPGLLETYEENR